MLIKELMQKEVVSVSATQSVYEAARLMDQNNVGALCVLSGKTLRGIVTDRDLVLRCNAQGKDPKKTKVSEVMTGSVACVTPEHSALDAAEMMSCEKVRRIPVVSKGRLEGIVTMADLAKARCEAELSQALSEILLEEDGSR